MQPDSITLIVLLALGSAAMMVAVVRWRPVVAKGLAGLLAMLLSAAAGIAVVNDYYGYYQNWSQLSADLSGSYSSFASAPVGSRRQIDAGSGRIESVTLTGARSGITRSGLVYLPPQYFRERYAHTRFPVVELLHGTPGVPSDWPNHLDVASVMNRLISQHELGPMVLVMPTMSVGSRYQECVDAPGAQDDTYITHDVRTDVERAFRVSTDSAQWGIARYSSGGYCAANLALRHRSAFGAAGALDGYFRPGDGPAAAALNDDPAAERANDPLLAATELTTRTAPLPSFWLSAGTGNAGDTAAATAFGKALHGVEKVTLYREPGAGHNFYAWRPAVPRVLEWMWTQLATPDLRVRFPVAGAVRNATIRGGVRERTRRRSGPPVSPRRPVSRSGA